MFVLAATYTVRWNLGHVTCAFQYSYVFLLFVYLFVCFVVCFVVCLFLLFVCFVSCTLLVQLSLFLSEFVESRTLD